MRFADVVSRLEQGLAGALPGVAAQARAAPIPRREWPPDFNPARIRHAAGLLLVYPAREMNAGHAGHAENRKALRAQRAPRSRPVDAHIVLTVRGDTLGRHGGQVSMPGGVVDPGETFEQAALREAHEEIALDVNGVRVLGALTSVDIPVSGFRLHPIVATVDRRPAFVPADVEVAHILDVPVADLMRPRTFHANERLRDGVRVTIPAFHVGDHEIWGATAMVLAEFLTLLGW